MPRKRKGKVPRGAYPLPNGNWAIESSSAAKHGKRKVTVIGELRGKPDATLIAKAIIEHAWDIVERDRSGSLKQDASCRHDQSPRSLILSILSFLWVCATIEQ